MQDELLRLQAETGATVVFVTHDIAEATKLATRILVLSPHPGQVKANLDVARFPSREALAETVGALIHEGATA
jgi:NitT/TauT family transport system ATP-binding protein